MFHQKIVRQKAGQPITARMLNQIIELLERVANLRVSSPLAITDTPMGPLLYIGKGFIDSAWGETGSGFTAASGTPPVPTSQTITLYDVKAGSPPVFTARGSTVTAWNAYRSNVAGSKLGFFVQTGDGSWWIVTTDC